MALGEEIDARALPPLPSSVIAYVDGYGNLKTTIPYDAKKIQPGQRIRVCVNDHEIKATVSDGAFAVRHGELAFAPGSSGWPLRHGGSVRWERMGSLQTIAHWLAGIACLETVYHP